MLLIVASLTIVVLKIQATFTLVIRKELLSRIIEYITEDYLV